MKRILAFLLLFGGGLLVLRWLEPPRSNSSAAEPEDISLEPDSEGATGLVLGGSVNSPIYDKETGRTTLRFEAKDSTTSGEYDRFFDARFELLDPEEELPVAEIVLYADARIRRTGESGRFTPRYEELVHLTQVRAEVLRGTPLVPLTVLTEEAEIDARVTDERRVLSDGDVQLDSPRLVADGHGLTIDPDRHILIIHERGKVIFSQDGEPVARLSSEGPIRFQREQRNQAEISIIAQEGALLETFLDEGTRLEADLIRVRGVEAQDPNEEFAIQLVEAEGNVIAHAGANQFEARRAQIRFDAHGLPSSAILEELPVARLALTDQAQLLPANVAPGDLAQVTLDGEGPLDLLWGEEDRFHMRGRSTLHTQGATMRSAGGIRGWADRERKRTGFHAEGGVVLEGDTGTLQTPTLDLEVEGTRIHGIATGGPLFSGRLEDGREFRLTSPNRAEVVSENDQWRVLEATNVVFWVDEPDGFEARAERVEDLQLEPLGFTATGNIRIENARGTWTGERLTVESTDEEVASERTINFILEGTPEKMAIFDGPEGRAEALRVEGTNDEFHARGRVLARLRPFAGGGTAEADLGLDPSELYDLSADELDVWRARADGKAGSNEESTPQLHARGNVRARVISPNEETRIDADEMRVERSVYPATEELPARSETRIEANGQVRSHLIRPLADHPDSPGLGTRMDLNCDRLIAIARQRASERVSRHAEAHGSVHFDMWRDRVTSDGRPLEPLSLSGDGGLFVLDDDQNGTLAPGPGETMVSVRGELPSHGAPFELRSQEFLFFGGDRLLALEPSLQLEDMRRGADIPSTLTARARNLVATQDAIELTGDVRIQATTAAGIPWQLLANKVRFEGDATADTEVRSFHASENVEVKLGVRGKQISQEFIALARGAEIDGRTMFGTLRLSGSPAYIQTPIVATEVEWVEINIDLQVIERAGPGRLVPRRVDSSGGKQPPENRQLLGPWQEGATPQQEGVQIDPIQSIPLFSSPEWELKFDSWSTRISPDSLIIVLSEPRFRHLQRKSELRASWALLWLDRERWQQMPEAYSASNEAGEDSLRFEPEEMGIEEAEEPKRYWLFGMFEATDFGGVLREAYFEGPVEVLLDGDQIARADAVYMDVVAGHGWLAEATVNVRGDLVGQDFDKLTVKTRWLRHSSDGTLHANQATVTPCDYEDPHLQITTGDLKIKQEGEKQFRVSLSDNRIEAYDLIKLPLPPLNYASDKKGRPLWETVSFGDSSRFGSFVSAGVVRPAGGAGKALNDFLGGNPFDYDASYSIDASWLGSRGVLLDLGLHVESKEVYWMEMFVGGLPDNGKDRGYIPVPESERDQLRLWYRSQGRWDFGNGHWIDFVYSEQTDAGVQSEFYERQFERYELAETYVEWGKAYGTVLGTLTVEPRVEDFRTVVEELPTAQLFNGRTNLGQLGDVSLLYTGNLRGQYLRRRVGTPGEQSPFGIGDTYPDGLGSREVVRFDARQLLEAHWRTGLAGVSVTPFLDGRFTSWSEGVDESDSPSRVVGRVGTRVASTFWKRSSAGRMNEITPYVEVAGDFVDDLDDGDPVRFDQTEDPQGGQFVEIGTRARFGVLEDGTSRLDVDLSGTYGRDLPTGDESRWMPLESLARLTIEPLGVPVEMWYDSLIDPDQSETLYSLTAATIRISEDLRLEADHRRGRAQNGNPSFEAATLAGLFHWTDKWEFEARQTYSLTENDDLDSSILLRRFGHDIVFEIQSSMRRGEGGPSLSFSLEPRFGYKPKPVGYLRW